jgi:hypothetical protein
MIELFKIEAQDPELKNTSLRSFEGIPRIHVAKNGKTGREFIQLGRQNYTKVLVRHGIKISIFSGVTEDGDFKSGIRVENSTTTGKRAK